MDEQRRRAGGGEGGRDLARDMAGLAHAGDHHPPGGGREQSHGAREALVEAGGEGAQRGRLATQHIAGDFEIGARLGEGEAQGCGFCIGTPLYGRPARPGQFGVRHRR